MSDPGETRWIQADMGGSGKSQTVTGWAQADPGIPRLDPG